MSAANTYHPVVFDTDLIRHHDVSGPRYTSYPTADRFVPEFDAAACRSWLGRRAIGGANGMSRPLSLYVHLPFCNTICYYCACNKIITKDHGRSAKYIKYLAREMQLQTDALQGGRDVIQLHWGGGTPTFLSGEEMRDLMGHLRHHFNFLAHGEYSIEIDPRRVDAARIALLAELGFNRMSIGVQDFAPDVQAAVNRLQSEEETRVVIDAARAHGFASVSLDLIYGLPLQTPASFNDTLNRVLALQPDRLSVYNYAHLPQLAKPQRRIQEADLPAPEAKLEILQNAIERLTAAGYVFIGMDHFAKPDDELAIAQRQGRLHRNFQGYSTYADTDLLAFGVSAIGKIGPAYVQNFRTLDDYYARLDAHTLPVMRGLVLSADDLLRRTIIQSLMCHFTLSIAALEAAHLIDFRSYFAEEIIALEAMAADGLLTLDEQQLDVTPAGRILVRVIAMVFDQYLRKAQAPLRYSKVI